jgi:hypothetical protein
MYKIILILVPALLITLIDTKNVAIFAHNFNTDDNSSYLTLINKLTIEN